MNKAEAKKNIQPKKKKNLFIKNRKPIIKKKKYVLNNSIEYK
jgi:hypothetical protein